MRGPGALVGTKSRYPLTSAQPALTDLGRIRRAAKVGNRVRRGRIPFIKPKVSRVANIKSQKKRILTNEKARLRNKAVKSALRTHVRKFREAVAAEDTEKAAELARVACKALDRAVSKGVIHKNQAANRKSAIAQTAASV